VSDWEDDVNKAKIALSMIGQLAVLALLCRAGYVAADLLQLPLPGNLVGMVLLLMLLGAGVVRLTWVERTANLLLRHLAFFFVPIAVGIMGLGVILREIGILLLAVLAASAAVGIIAAGFGAQTVTRLAARMHAAERPAPPL
jgi:holin-like protein